MRRPYSSKKSMSSAPRHPSSAALPPLSPAHALAVAFVSCSCKCAITMHSSAYDPIPPLYTSLSARCCRNAFSTVTSGRNAGKRRVLARTISALAGPFATSKEMSNWNPLCFSMNLTMGTRALAMSWMSVAMPLRDRLSASALRHVAGAFAPLSRITASTSLFGRYMPVAKLPCTSKRAPGQIASTAARTRATEPSRASRSAAVGSRNRQKSTISACRRNIGDRSVFRRADAPGGHQTGAASESRGSTTGASLSGWDDTWPSPVRSSAGGGGSGAAEASAPCGSRGASSKSTANPAAALATTAAYEGALSVMRAIRGDGEVRTCERQGSKRVVYRAFRKDARVSRKPVPASERNPFLARARKRLAPVSFGRRRRRGTGQTEAKRGKTRAPKRREAPVLYGALRLAGGGSGGGHVADSNLVPVFSPTRKAPALANPSRALCLRLWSARSHARELSLGGLGFGLFLPLNQRTMSVPTITSCNTNCAWLACFCLRCSS